MAAHSAQGHAREVGQFYSQVEQGQGRREESRIVRMRKFNNFIKSVLINMYVKEGDVMLDLASGKGGDLNKWAARKVRHVVFADVAKESVEQSKERYEERHTKSFSASFHVADLTRDPFDTWDPPLAHSVQFNSVSCQFALHYCFESQKQCRQFIKNAANRLKPGGFFFGCTPWAEEIVRRKREAEKKKKNSFGNAVYSIRFDEESEDPPSCFGAKYHFQLEEQVDVAEFLVNFDVLEYICKMEGLKLILRKSFKDFFTEQARDGDAKALLQKMDALETVRDRGPQNRRPGLTYAHGEDFCGLDYDVCGTLSRQEWECTSLYVVFCFQKMRD